MKKTTVDRMSLIHSLKKKIQNDGKLCDKDFYRMNTWKKFNAAIKNKKIILYGTGEMFTWFCEAYGTNYDILYAVDRNASVKNMVKNGISVYPVETLCKISPQDSVILVTPINGIEDIFLQLRQKGIQTCFSFPIMEYQRIAIKLKVWLACIWKPYTRYYQQQWAINNLNQRLLRTEQRLESAVTKINELQKRQTERYFHILHMKRIINALIDKTDDIELKKEQICYSFKHIHKNSYIPDLDNPRSYNEKILAMTLYDHNPLYTQITDKYLAKKYIAQKIGERYVVPLLGVWNSADEVSFDELPEQFVIKSNMGGDSEKVILVKNKSEVDLLELKKQIKTWGAPYQNDYYYNFNWPFKDIKFKIIAEEYLPVDELSHYDYKVHCFHGIPQYIHVVRKNPHEVSYYDLEWNRQDFWRLYPPIQYDIPKPDCLDEMLSLSRTLSEPFDYVRVDFYVVKDELYLGELTLTSFGGLAPFEPTEIDFEWGKLI